MVDSLRETARGREFAGSQVEFGFHRPDVEPSCFSEVEPSIQVCVEEGAIGDAFVCPLVGVLCHGCSIVGEDPVEAETDIVAAADVGFAIHGNEPFGGADDCISCGGYNLVPNAVHIRGLDDIHAGFVLSLSQDGHSDDDMLGMHVYVLAGQDMGGQVQAPRRNPGWRGDIRSRAPGWPASPAGFRGSSGSGSGGSRRRPWW